MARAFLTAEWRNLIMLNYVVEPSVLLPYLPRGTELDSWHGKTFVSLVGFLFVNARLLGIPIPAHRNFEEVNLRFYVRRTENGVIRRGVTFIREIVPRSAIAIVARFAYNEPYRALPMRHHFADTLHEGVPSSVGYGWQSSHEWLDITAEPLGEGDQTVAGSEEEFITEHYWGYTKQADGSTIAYRVDHPRWRVWKIQPTRLAESVSNFYGSEFAPVLAQPPHSAFLADGSAITVYSPTRLGSNS